MQDEQQLPLLVAATPARSQESRKWYTTVCSATAVLLIIIAASPKICGVWLFRPSPDQDGDASKSGLRTGPDFVIDLEHTRHGNDYLWGSFFEEINHAGEGGLYAELIQDRSFDALVNVLGAEHDSPMTVLPRTSVPTDSPMPWSVLHGSGNTTVALVSQAPAISLNGVAGDRRRAVKVSTSAERGGLANSGFWGIRLQAGRQYNLTVWAAAWAINNDPNAADSPSCPSISARSWAVDVGLQASVKGANVSELASASFLLTCRWTKFTAILTPTASVKDALLTITARQASDILLDHVSLMPLWTAAELAELAPVKQTGGPDAGIIQPWPFRHDLFMMLKNLKPRFLRFPGGCFVEGQRLANAEHWKNTVGPVESRPGHWNLWGYWSTDGLGLYEYLLLSEALGAEPVWVTNSGMAHEDQIPPSGLMPWIQEALDGLEFIMGPADSKWGALRAAMGHPEPFQLKYMAVGNEDAGMPFYSDTYVMFWAALKSRYPQLKLIANDEIHPVGAMPNDLWDFHVYTDPYTLFNMSATFDNFNPQRSNVFVSEFAVTQNAGRGNVIAAVSEAAFMTGMERNADTIELASYAPLFVNTNDRKWNPDMIVFDGAAVYGTPSYWVGHLFSDSYYPFLPRITSFLPDGTLVRASAVCTTATCSRVNVRVVNMYTFDVAVELTLVTRGGFPEAQLREHVMVIGEPQAENSFEAPEKIAPVAGKPGAVQCKFGRTCTVLAQGMSANFLSFDVVTA